MIVRDKWKEPKGLKTYVSTGKAPESNSTDKDLAYWMLAQKIEDEFGSKPVTIQEIYYQVTGPVGLSSSETIKLIRSAKARGFIK